jgi:hypothetical protein
VYPRGVRIVVLALLVGCYRDAAPPPRNVATPPARTTIGLTPHGIGALTIATPVTLDGLKRALPQFEVRERRIDEYNTVLDVLDRGELLYYVVPNHDHTISEVHILSDRIVAWSGWRIGGVVPRRPEHDTLEPDDMGGCKCGELTADVAFAFTSSDTTLGASFGECTKNPNATVEFVNCPISGKIGRMVWIPSNWRALGP